MGGDPLLAEQAVRLALSAELTHRAGRIAAARDDAPGQDPLPAARDDGPAEDPLVALALRLAPIAAPVGRAHGLAFAPPFPGVTGGVEATRGGRRLVLACTASAIDGGHAVAVILTTLIAGRPPRVTAAPPSTPVPPRWRAPGAV